MTTMMETRLAIVVARFEFFFFFFKFFCQLSNKSIGKKQNQGITKKLFKQIASSHLEFAVFFNAFTTDSFNVDEAETLVRVLDQFFSESMGFEVGFFFFLAARRSLTLSFCVFVMIF